MGASDIEAHSAAAHVRDGHGPQQYRSWGGSGLLQYLLSLHARYDRWGEM